MTQTILVTGATGYIGKHIVLQLLEAGYLVVASTRDLSRQDELAAALRPHLSSADALDRLRLVALDLNADEGWDTAMEGVDMLMHTASPFPLSQPKDEDELIRPAVDGALRAVKAAQKAGIRRVVMTSSVAAILSSDLTAGRDRYTEEDWTDITHPSATAYVKSKTLAEKAVWDWARTDGPGMQITMINPGFVQGAPLDDQFGTSVEVVGRLLRGQDPMVPRVGFPCVDVRDIALMHLRALERPDSIGKRFIGVDRFLWFQDMAVALKSQHPTRKIATLQAPNLLIRFLSLFDPSIRTILPTLSQRQDLSTANAEQILGLSFRDSLEAVRQTGAYLVERDLV